MNNNKQYLSTKEASERINIAVGTLNNWAWKKTGPRFYKVSSRRMYSAEDLDNFIKSNPIPTIDQFR